MGGVIPRQQSHIFSRSEKGALAAYDKAVAIAQTTPSRDWYPCIFLVQKGVSWNPQRSGDFKPSGFLPNIRVLGGFLWKYGYFRMGAPFSVVVDTVFGLGLVPAQLCHVQMWRRLTTQISFGQKSAQKIASQGPLGGSPYVFFGAWNFRQ